MLAKDQFLILAFVTIFCFPGVWTYSSLNTIDWARPSSPLNPLEWHLHYFMLWALYIVLDLKFYWVFMNKSLSSIFFPFNFFYHFFSLSFTTLSLWFWWKHISLMNLPSFWLRTYEFFSWFLLTSSKLCKWRWYLYCRTGDWTLSVISLCFYRIYILILSP